MKTFCLPDLGEGLAEGEISKWHVKIGDTINVDDPLVSIETAKAVVEVPAPWSGKIIKLYGKEGDIIPTDSPLVDFEGEGKQETGTVAGEILVGNQVLTEKATAISSRAGGIKVLPAVRALAKKLNVDLNAVIPSGVDGTITAEDVKKANATLSNAAPLEPLRGVRRTMAIVMEQSHAQVVPVTVVDDADITAWVKEKNFTVRLILAMVKACAVEPALNCWYDGQSMGRRLWNTMHIGLAMDTGDGLFVPVLRDAQEKSAIQLKEEIEQLKQAVQNRTIAPQQLQGATMVLSNFGKFAGRYANPIVTVPMVAILGVGSVREEVRAIKAAPSIRSILPLSLTVDHRAVTGGEATRFLATVLQNLQAP